MSKALRITLIVFGILVVAGGLVLLVSGEGEPQRPPGTPHSAMAYSLLPGVYGKLITDSMGEKAIPNLFTSFNIPLHSSCIIRQSIH